MVVARGAEDWKDLRATDLASCWVAGDDWRNRVNILTVVVSLRNSQEVVLKCCLRIRACVSACRYLNLSLLHFII